MPITTTETDAQLAARLATEAGARLVELRRRMWAAGAVPWEVMDGGDMASHHFLAGELAAARPGDAVLSEEGTEDTRRFEVDRVWIIDPLDGTREFGECGRLDWAVHVALWERDRLAAGAVSLPALGRTFATDPPPELPPLDHERPRLVTSRSRPPAIAGRVAAALGAESVHLGSAGAKTMSIILGDADIYVHAGGQYQWDSAAPGSRRRGGGSVRQQDRRLCDRLQPPRGVAARLPRVPQGARRRRAGSDRRLSIALLAYGSIVPVRSSPGLELDSLCKRYGDVVALDELSFDVRPGEVFGFVGSNGAGKTTAMRIALGVLSADAGEVRWHGAPITADVRRQLGYMPEERGLYPRMKVAEQLEYFGELHGMSKAAAAESSASWTERLGVAARRDDEVQKLSQGNQQRVQLAAALIHDPQALVLDEPFSGLDPVAVDVMSEVLVEQAASGVPVVFSSHQLELVERLCDRVGIVRDGSMLAVGSVDELRTGDTIRLVVGVPDAPRGWADGVNGVRSARREDGRTVVELERGADDQDVLAAALGHGPVYEFGRQRPSLMELFRDVVSAEGPDHG